MLGCVVSNGAVKMSAGSRPARDRIRKNYSYLEDELRSEEYAGVLFEKDCISQRDKDDLEDGRKSRREKAHLLTDILLRKSEQVIETFFEILRSERRKQPHIYYRLFPEHAHEHEQLSRHSHTQQQQSDNSSTYKETTEQTNVFDQSGRCKRDVSDMDTAGTLQGGRSEINVQASSSGAAGLLALRVPSTASLEVLTTAMEIARDVAVEGIARGHSSTVAGSEGGAAGGFAAVEVYVPKSEADSDLKECPPAVVADKENEASVSLLQDDRHEKIGLPDYSDSQRSAMVLEGRKTISQEYNNKLEQQATAKPCFYDDICRSGKSLIVVGGKGRPATIEKLSLATNNIDKSYCEILPKQNELHSCGAVVIGSEVFVVGGCSESYPFGSPFVLTYNPDNSKVDIKSTLIEGRSSCGVEVMCQILFAVGGQQGQKYLKSVEICRPETGYECWEAGPDLKTAKAGLVVVGVNNDKEHLYCIGGYDGESTLARMYVLKDGEWKKVTDMKDPRRDFAAVAVGNCIYAIGGCNDAGAIDCVERYDVRQKDWKKLSSLPTRRYGHSAVVINEKICVVGGYNSSNLCAVYDTRTSRWDEPLCCRIAGKTELLAYSLGVQSAFAGVAAF